MVQFADATNGSREGERPGERSPWHDAGVQLGWGRWKMGRVARKDDETRKDVAYEKT